MRGGIAAASLLAGVVIGFVFGVVWQRSVFERRKEAIIGKEIALLERHKDIPTCEQMQAARAGAGEHRSREALVVWRRVPANGKLQRLVVAHDMTTAYEEVEVSCPER